MARQAARSTREVPISMTGQNFPVLRAGTILRPKDGGELSPEDSVRVGRALFDVGAELTARFVEDAKQSIPDVADITVRGSYQDNAALRLRFAPALTMDFLPTHFTWDGLLFETRTAVTVCPGSTRGKLWVRFSTTEPLHEAHRVAEVRDRFFAWAPPVKALWLKYYNEVCRSVNKDVTFELAYAIDIFMTSSDGLRHGLKSLLDESAAERGEDRGTAIQALAVLNAELEDSAHLTLLDSPEKQTTRRIVTYRFPRLQTNEEEVSGNKRNVETLAEQDFEALCAIEIDPIKTTVYGVGLEPERPSSFRRSVSFVTSGEISFELGRIF